MSDKVTVTPADVAAKVDSPDKVNENPPSNGAPQPAVPAQEGTDWKAEARKWEERAKANKDAAERLAALEEAQKTEEQKTAERLAALEAENEKYRQAEQVSKWKQEVSAETEVPADLLAGSTLEEIQAHAERLKPHLAQPSNTPPPPVVSTVGNQPAPQGSVPLRDQIAAAEESGDKALVARLKALMLSGSDKT